MVCLAQTRYLECCRRLHFDPDADIHVNLPDADVALELAVLRARRPEHRRIGNWFISASAATISAPSRNRRRAPRPHDNGSCGHPIRRAATTESSRPVPVSMPISRSIRIAFNGLSYRSCAGELEEWKEHLPPAARQGTRADVACAAAQRAPEGHFYRQLSSQGNGSACLRPLQTPPFPWRRPIASVKSE